MTIANHILAGAIIGTAVSEPWLALPLAFASHFVMDAAPHFGYKGNQGFGEVLKHKLPYWVGTIDSLVSSILIAWLAIDHQLLALLAGLIAASPDIVGVYNYRRYERHGKKASGFVKLLHVQFHRAIQRYERPWGIYIELVAFSVLLTALINISLD